MYMYKIVHKCLHTQSTKHEHTCTHLNSQSFFYTQHTSVYVYIRTCTCTNTHVQMYVPKVFEEKTYACTTVCCSILGELNCVHYIHMYMYMYNIYSACTSMCHSVTKNGLIAELHVRIYIHVHACTYVRIHVHVLSIGPICLPFLSPQFFLTPLFSSIYKN